MNAPLHQIISTIGITAALRLIEAFGGVRIYLPLPGHITADNNIAKVIGVEKARALAAAWSQERPYLPRAADYLRRERNRALARDKKELSVRQLALKYELTERQVYAILAAESGEADAAPGTTAQPSLF